MVLLTQEGLVGGEPRGEEHEGEVSMVTGGPILAVTSYSLTPVPPLSLLTLDTELAQLFRKVVTGWNRPQKADSH